MTVLTFRVADSLTGRLIGVLRPSEWTFDDPLTGAGRGSVTIALPNVGSDVDRLVSLTRPLNCQIGAQDDQGRWWFGGPITAEPAVADRKITVPFADWRAWFYSASLDDDFIRVATDQVLNLVELAATRVGGVGAPRLVIDNAATSGVLRNIAVRKTTMIGDALDDIARRDSGADWYTYLATDPNDPTSVIAHLSFAYPERDRGYGLFLRYRLGSGGNLFGYTWPEGNAPVTRVVGVQGTPPDQLVVTAEDPDVGDGDTLAWDEVYSLPQGVTADTAFDYTLARLTSRSNGGTVACDLDPAATDLGAWGPGDRVRLSVRDGWRDIDTDRSRVLTRTISGRGPYVTAVKMSVSLDEPAPDIPTPTPVVI